MDSSPTPRAAPSSTSRSVLIIGGGTAGWMTAAYLAKTLGTDQTGGPKITLIESPEIGIIGVGEGTFPTIRTTLKTLGIDEATFLRECHATFKQGIRFDDWEYTPRDGVHSHYLHPFEAPFLTADELNLQPYWLLEDPKTRPSFAEAMTFQKRLTDENRAPKMIHQGHYSGRLSYAYHFDATRFADLLARHAKSLGVHHMQGTLSHATLDDTGAIDYITTPEHGDLKADFYVDCTGFRSELIGKALNVPFKSIKSTLFTDRAVTCQVPYDAPDAPLPSYTISSAHEAGWTWDIGLHTRRGIGYVYSSDHSSDERAEEVLRAYVGKADITPRRIRFEAGYRTKHWVKNCLCVGLSGGFLEPLELTGLVLIELALIKFAEFFPHQGPLDASADIFNDQMVRRYETIIGFIKLHYCLTKREEPFWRDNTRPESIPQQLQDRLKLWKNRPPSRFDFIIDYESFAYFSYQYILYGMGFETDIEAARASYLHADKAEMFFAKIRGFGEQALRDLPTHRALIEQVYASGFVDKPQRELMSVSAKR